MAGMTRSWFKRNILDNGTRLHYGHEKNLAIQVCNLILVITMVILASFYFSDVKVGAYTLSRLNVVANLLSLLSFFVIRWGKDWFGRILFAVIINCIVFLGIDQLGSDSGGQFFYFCLGLVPFIVFERDHKKTVLALSLLPLFLWSIPQFFGYQIFLKDAVQTIPSMNDVADGFLSAYLISIFAFGYFYTIYGSSQLELQKTRALLAHQSQMSVLGEMAGGMAHEINNPLTIIVGKIQIMQWNLQKGTFDKNKLLEYILTIEKAADRITHVIKSLSAFSKNIEKDPIEYRDIRALVLSTLELCQQRFPDPDIVIFKENISTVLKECRPGHLSQALYAVIQNSFEAVKSHNEKWIRIELIGLDKKSCEISVTDSGHGIDPMLRNKIFEPFFTTKEVGQGSGLGLAAAKGLIEAQSGKLELDTSCSNTRFVIRLS